MEYVSKNADPKFTPHRTWPLTGRKTIDIVITTPWCSSGPATRVYTPGVELAAVVSGNDLPGKTARYISSINMPKALNDIAFAVNILGRRRAYAQTGHGGNRELWASDFEDLRFSILQRTSPDLDARLLRWRRAGRLASIRATSASIEIKAPADDAVFAT